MLQYFASQSQLRIQSTHTYRLSCFLKSFRRRVTALSEEAEL